jgi:hypothetical protein
VKKIITLAVLIIVLIIMGMLDFLPWWSFLIPIFLLGVFLPFQKLKIYPFLWGFIAGFLVWFLYTVYLEMTYKGEIMQSVAKIMKVKPYLLHLSIGVIGGLLTGLGLYSGYVLRKGREVLELELPGN